MDSSEPLIVVMKCPNCDEETLRLDPDYTEENRHYRCTTCGYEETR